MCLRGSLAQTDRGSITGTVKDPGGAVIAGAHITIRSLVTASAYDTLTTDTGNYLAAQLPASVYEMTVVSPGFSTYIQKGIRVEVAQTARVDVSLVVGSTQESVTVTADAPLLKTDSAEVNEALNAGNPFTDDGNGHLVRPRSRVNGYGGSVGGPVWIPHAYNGRNKTFFLFNIERSPSTSSTSGAAQTVPTAAFRNGDFSSILTNGVLGSDPLGNKILENTIYDPATRRLAPNGQVIADAFPGDKIPVSRFDPVAVRIQALFPLPLNSQAVNHWVPVTHPVPGGRDCPLFGLESLCSRGRTSSCGSIRFGVSSQQSLRTFAAREDRKLCRFKRDFCYRFYSQGHRACCWPRQIGAP